MALDVHTPSETDQPSSQDQREALHILTMSQEELHEFLQNEEIENPLFDYSMADMSYPERIRQIRSPVDKNFSIADFVMSQIPEGQFSPQEKKAVRYAIDMLDERGFLTVSAYDMAKDLSLPQDLTEHVLDYLKNIEPKGLFAADLTECLELQVTGMEQESLLKHLIRNHLTHIAEGNIGEITRDLKISSAEARKLIAAVRDLNPKPLNGYTQNQIEYIIPDIEIHYEDGQWAVELNDGWSGQIGINDFYVKMLENAEDEELKTYFQEKLKRARFVVDSVVYRRSILVKISSYIARHQDGYFRRHKPLKPMTADAVGRELSLNPSILTQAIQNKYLSSPRGTIAFKDLL